MYSVLVSAPSGCYEIDSIVVFAYDTIFSKQTIVLCDSNSFPYIITPPIPYNYQNSYYWNGNGDGGQYNNIWLMIPVNIG